MPDTRRIRLCVVGATGRMGSTIIREAPHERFEVTAAVAAAGEPGIGQTLRDLGVGSSDVVVQPPGSLQAGLESSDVCISFTSASAEMANVPIIASAGKPLVLGTTGFTEEQRSRVVGWISSSVPAVMTSNFSIGANMLFAVAGTLRNLPPEFDVSIVEMHHSGKADAPSGTALTLADIVSKARGYSKTVHGRSGVSRRSKDEIEVVALRGGGTPGVHEVYAFGPNEMLKFEHLALSRSVFAQGALLASGWVADGRAPGVYSMLDVLGFRV